ncbi:hypothetical protein GCM10010300_39200 [Streptomyces olivaceoviridis]|uniref:DUF3291 domain-containing protein n=1 Tax=Streptomyces olivaceoviridis TaxID=1921 RepID=UPI00167A6972|nr:DUF3291 domain-containing protein [Streptomyces olivaceoviridis]GGY91194.1 hypothetical protein GCM10010300_39200 [Streptomyces olivaceoviridis]
MPTLPWTVPNSPPAGAEAHVSASRFVTRTLWGALRSLVRTPAVRRQADRAPGACGATLRAQPLRRTSWTLSAGESAAALKEFARSGAHRPTSRALADRMRDVRCATWQASAGALPMSWEEATRRLT